MIESGPVWSAMTPTLMGSSPESGDAVMISSLAVALAVAPERELRRVVGRILLGRRRPKHREDSPSSSHRFVWVSWSRRWRSRRTTRSGSRSSRSSARACSRAGCARRPDSTRSYARPSTGWRCSGSSAAPATPTRSRRCSATRSRSAGRRSSTTRAIPRRSCATSSPSQPPAATRRSATRSSRRSRRRSASGRSSTSRPAARWPTCSSSGSTSARTSVTRSGARSSAGTGTGTRTTSGRGDPAPDAHRPRQPSTWRRSAAASRPSARSRPRTSAAARRTTRRWPTSSSRTGATGSTGSPATEPWDAVLALEPEPHRLLTGAELDDALSVVADFIDLKSPYWGGHSRRCAKLAEDAAGVLGLADAEVTTLRRAALVHDFGTTVVPNSIWDKPGPLTRSEFDRVELHPMLTEQMLRRSPALAVLNPVACAHHEKCDGSGYHKRVRAADDRPRRVRPRGGGGVRRVDRRASGPPAVLGRRCGRRAAPARVGRRPRASREPCGSGGRRPRRAERAHGQAAAEPGRAHAPRGRGAPARREGPHDAATSRAASTSRPRPPTTTSSTSTARSACRRVPRRLSGRCSTPWSPEGAKDGRAAAAEPRLVAYAGSTIQPPA